MVSLKQRYIGLVIVNLALSIFFVLNLEYPDFGLPAIIQFFIFILAPFLIAMGGSLIIPFIAYVLFFLLRKPTNKILIFYIFVASNLIIWFLMLYPILFL